MKQRIIKTGKVLNLVKANICCSLLSTPAFIRIIPTDNCNMNCKYCRQKDNAPFMMSYSNFKSYLKKARKMQVGLITFLGGEPLMWEHVYQAIADCTRHLIPSDLTTNGSYLNEETIEKLGKAGLDYLNISVDGIRPNRVSGKNYIFRNNLTELLKKAQKKYKMDVRLNTVIYNNNLDDIRELLEYTKENGFRISLGYAMPPLNGEDAANPMYFRKEDRELLKKIISYIIVKKREGYPIIDPEEYFLNIFRFLNRESFWQCNYQTKYGWLNIAPNGQIRSCTKKQDDLHNHFSSLKLKQLVALRRKFAENISSCNSDCYSNCAYDAYYYRKHKGEMIKKLLKKVN